MEVYKKIQLSIHQTNNYKEKIEILQDAISRYKNPKIKEICKKDVEKIETEIKAIINETIFSVEDHLLKNNLFKALEILNHFEQQYPYLALNPKFQICKINVSNIWIKKSNWEISQILMLEMYGDSKEARIRLQYIKNMLSTSDYENFHRKYNELLEKILKK